MTDGDLFKLIKTHLAALDDLGQERRKLYTDWATKRLEPTDFVNRMVENLGLTRKTAEDLEGVLPR